MRDEVADRRTPRRDTPPHAPPDAGPPPPDRARPSVEVRRRRRDRHRGQQPRARVADRVHHRRPRPRRRPRLARLDVQQLRPDRALRLPSPGVAPQPRRALPRVQRAQHRHPPDPHPRPAGPHERPRHLLPRLQPDRDRHHLRRALPGLRFLDLGGTRSPRPGVGRRLVSLRHPRAREDPLAHQPARARRVQRGDARRARHRRRALLDGRRTAPAGTRQGGRQPDRLPRAPGRPWRGVRHRPRQAGPDRGELAAPLVASRALHQHGGAGPPLLPRIPRIRAPPQRGGGRGSRGDHHVGPDRHREDEHRPAPADPAALGLHRRRHGDRPARTGCCSATPSR